MTWATFSGGQTPGVPRPHSLPFPRARRSNRSRERRRAPTRKRRTDDPIRSGGRPAVNVRAHAAPTTPTWPAGLFLLCGLWRSSSSRPVLACVEADSFRSLEGRHRRTRTSVCSSGGGARLTSVQPAVAFLVRPRAAHGRVVRSGRAGGHVPTFCPCVRACVYQCLCVRRLFFFECLSPFLVPAAGSLFNTAPKRISLRQEIYICSCRERTVARVVRCEDGHATGHRRSSSPQSTPSLARPHQPCARRRRQADPPVPKRPPQSPSASPSAVVRSHVHGSTFDVLLTRTHRTRRPVTAATLSYRLSGWTTPILSTVTHSRVERK
jgi:hypothetical protein